MNIRCPLCDQEFDNSEDGARAHVWVFHKPPRGLDFFTIWKEKSAHFLQVARGEAPLAKNYQRFLGKGRHTREASELAKGKSKVVLDTEVSPTRSPPSNITHATQKKRRK